MAELPVVPITTPTAALPITIMAATTTHGYISTKDQLLVGVITEVGGEIIKRGRDIADTEILGCDIKLLSKARRRQCRALAGRQL